jgi:hypothetical protein
VASRPRSRPWSPHQAPSRRARADGRSSGRNARGSRAQALITQSTISTTATVGLPASRSRGRGERRPRRGRAARYGRKDEPLPRAIAAVERLRSAGAALRFVTNTTSRSRAATLEKLTRLGFTVASDELITPVALAVRLCRERGYRRVALLVPPDTEAEFAGLETIAGETGADAVIVGDLGEAWNYAAVNRAFRLVMDGAALIALQKNRFWLRADRQARASGRGHRR